MARIGYRHLAVALTALSGLACAGLRVADAAAADKPAAAAAGKLENFPAEAVVLRSPHEVAAFDGSSGRVTISTRQGDQLKRRAEATFGSVEHFKSYRWVRSDGPAREGIEIYSDSAEAQFTVLVDDQGILEFKPGKARQLVLHGLRLAHGLVPSLVGTDFLYDANTAPGAQRLHIPSLNLVLGLVDGEDCMAVGVWPPGKQSAAFGLAPGAGAKLIDSFTFDTDGQSFYFSCQEQPGIWHAERLKRNYLEKDTTIAWKRPFEAKWLGRFFITSDEYDWPFYFGSKPLKIWGRYIRGWYKYPVRFDGDHAVVHFEKQFLPKGDLLIYCLEPHPTDPSRSIVTPAEIMAIALGKAQAEKILDPEGAVEQTLLDHRLAVCAMTNTMQAWLNEERHPRIATRCCGGATIRRLSSA